MTDESWGFATRAIHAGLDADRATGPGVRPDPVSPAAQDDADGGGGPLGGESAGSARSSRTALEEALAAVEGGAAGFAFESGLAAQDVLLRATLRPGDHVVLGQDVDGGTYHLVADVMGPWGVEHTVADLTDTGAVLDAIRPGQTKLVWVETPAGPLLRVTDIAAVSAHARAAGAVLVVDNTLVGPAVQNPLALGADVVVHSMAACLGGHGDRAGGALVVADGAQLPAGLDGPGGTTSLRDALAFQADASGAAARPREAGRILQGLATVQLRSDRHGASAARIAEHLVGHPGVAQVVYPGLADHPGHGVAARQMRGFGGMLSFRTGSTDAAAVVRAATTLFRLAGSPGGVVSLVGRPARLPHGPGAGSVPALDDLVCLWVGLEDADDLVADLDQALAAVTR